MVIGEVASILHGVPRSTFDLYILVEATKENAQRLLKAGMGTASLITVEDLLAHEITVFQDKVRLDVQTSTPGVNFQEAWTNREKYAYHGQEFFIASKKDLVAMKRADGREIGLEDVRFLVADEE